MLQIKSSKVFIKQNGVNPHDQNTPKKSHRQLHSGIMHHKVPTEETNTDRSSK